MPILSLLASLTLARSEWIMQDIHLNTEFQHKMFRFAQNAVQEAPECRESRVAEAQDALKNHSLMLDAAILASRIMADPLHQVHCDA